MAIPYLTLDYVPGYNVVEYLGPVEGMVSTNPSFVGDFFMRLSNFFGGRSGTLDRRLWDAKEQALAMMLAQADAAGATIVLGVRFAMMEAGSGNFVVVNYLGTAVRVAKKC